ncbi:hypothetical protein BDZ97DRAFT_1755318 [Flammula alnicola]|nr:hypothetical protein BDZ97DRAFT_1755318 [Flammula alnicola]
MDSRVDDTLAFAKREIPMIGGSSAAFIAIVVILVVVIAIACTAVVILLREDMAEDGEALTRRARGRYHLSGFHGPSVFNSTRDWFTRVLGISGSHQRVENDRADKSRIIKGHPRQGWLQAGNGSDWDSDSIDDRPTGKQKNATASTMVRMMDREPSMGTPRSSNAGSFPHLSRVYSPGSDTASSVRFDLNSARGIPYAEPSSLSRQGIIPSIQSHLYSSPSTQSSPSPSPAPRQPASRMALTSAESLGGFSSNDSADNIGISNPFAAPSQPSIRTFKGGSKFIEAL